MPASTIKELLNALPCACVREATQQSDYSFSSEMTSSSRGDDDIRKANFHTKPLDVFNEEPQLLPTLLLNVYVKIPILHAHMMFGLTAFNELTALDNRQLVSPQVRVWTVASLLMVSMSSTCRRRSKTSLHEKEATPLACQRMEAGKEKDSTAMGNLCFDLQRLSSMRKNEHEKSLARMNNKQ